MTCVYVHSHPVTGVPFYIGVGLRHRPYDFNARSRDHKAYVRELRAEGLSPSVRVVADDLSKARAYDMEMALISEYGGLDLGAVSLLNRDDGGRGGHGIIRTAEIRERQSAGIRKCFEDPAHREKMRQSIITRYQQPGEREKIARVSAARWAGPEARERGEGPHRSPRDPAVKEQKRRRSLIK